MPNQKIHFAWNNKATKNFVVKDSKGKEIFKKAIGKTNSIDILPRMQKLKVGEKYSWSVDDDLNIFQFTVLDEQTEKEIIANLAEIDAKNFTVDERALQKARYLQLLSDNYPDEFDLYWLSAQLLSEISPADQKLSAEKFDLLEKCEQHINTAPR